MSTATRTRAKFEIYKDANGKFRWRLKAPNGEIIAASEAYESKHECQQRMRFLIENAPTAETEDLTVVHERIQRVRYLMSSVMCMEMKLEAQKPVDLDGEIIAMKNKDGSIALYEVIK